VAVALEDRARRIRASGANTAYIYFDNDEAGRAARDALALRAMPG